MPGSSPEDTSEVETEVETKPDTADVKVDPAESSSAEPKGEKPDLLSAVKAALKPADASPAAKTEGSEPAKDAAALDKDADKATEADDLTEEELARLKPKTQKRIENLTAARRERDGKIAELEPKAQQFEKMQRFISDARLSIPEVNDGFEVMRLLKNDPLKAWERLEPIFNQLQLMVGKVLPEDLQTAVNEGRLTEDHARELATTRSRAAVSTAQVQQRDRDDQDKQRQQSFKEHQTRVGTAVSEWEKSKAGSDPEWKLKQSRVMEIVRLETLERERADENFVWTPEDAVKFANTALDRVTKELKQFNPKPKAVTPITDVASTRSVAKPKNAFEAAKLALASAAG